METQNRRRFLTAAGAAAVAATAAACTSNDDAESAESASPGSDGSRTYPYRGVHQAGITAPPAPAGLVAGLDLRAENRGELAETLSKLGDSIEQVMSGEPYEDRAGGYPALDSGILGPDIGPAGLSVVVGYGDSLFDDRFGLADVKPIELQRMPNFFNDFLVRSERSHGDLSLTISGDNADAVMHAFRQLMRETRGDLTPRWMREGFNNLTGEERPGVAPGRNLLGFKDGTANLDTSDADLMKQQVWIDEADGQPDWAVGGSYQVIRVIRMMVEFWDRTRLNEQEALMGRHRDTGAPIGFEAEDETPVHGADLESHIARANPRTAGSEANLILRRNFNYFGGFDGNDQLDQGLLFICFQRSLEDGFITVQKRLDGEALEEYIRPLGGGFYFSPPAPAEGEILGERLLSA